MSKEDTLLVVGALKGKEKDYDCDFNDWLRDQGYDDVYARVKDEDIWYCDGMHRGRSILIVKEEDAH